LLRRGGFETRPYVRIVPCKNLQSTRALAVNDATGGLIMGKAWRKCMPICAFAAASLFVTSITAQAQGNYPSRPVKIIVPFPAGGVVDIVSRLVGERLQTKWGQPFIVENRSGASGNIGAETVVRSEPDGYTLLSAPPPPLAVNQFLFAKLEFDPSAFVPVTVIATLPNMLVAHPHVPAANVEQLIAFARANPDKLSYASTGIGGTPHLTAEMLKAQAGVRIVHVPYKGAAPAIVDLMAGHVDIMFANLSDSLEPVRSGKLAAIGVTSRQRLPALPNVAAVSETLPGFVSETWIAIVAPPGTPRAIAERLSAAIRESLAQADFANRLNDLLLTPMGSSPAETATFIKQDADRWRSVIVAAGIKGE
jgi:tripartite-type tricarboxylate transporter receptor subunit TctC